MNVLNNMNLEILKLPLGIIRVIEAVFCFITWWAITSSSSQLSYKAFCGGGKTVDVNINWAYPYSLTDAVVPLNSCNSSANKVQLFGDGAGSSGSAGFLVLVALASLVFCLLCLAAYLFFWDKYNNDVRYPNIDLAATFVASLLWLLASLLWWFGSMSLKAVIHTSFIQNKVNRKDKACSGQSVCTVTGWPSYAGLTISLLTSWTCFILFAANLWFVYKETSFWRNRQNQQSAAAPSFDGPPMPAGPPVDFK